jgi:hypothetical protein
MFSAITYIYNKKTKGPTLMELFTATGNLKKAFLQLEMFDVCTTSDTEHTDTIFKFLSCRCQHGCIDILRCCNDPGGRNVNYDEKQLSGGKNVWVVPSISIGFINMCLTVFLSYIFFVIPEYTMKRPVLYYIMSYYIILYYVILCHYIILHYITLYYIILYYIIFLLCYNCLQYSVQ